MKNSWLNIKEPAVSLLKIFAVSLVLIELSTTGIRVFQSVDDGYPWYSILSTILQAAASVAYYGGALFALSWIVSLIGRGDEVNKGSGCWRNKEEAISLLKKAAVLIVLLYLPIVLIKVFMAVDQEQSWDNIVVVMLGNITKAVYYGGTVFSLSWIVSLIGRQDEVNTGSDWLDNRESAVYLLKIFAVLSVLLQLSIAGIEIVVDVDWDRYWSYSVTPILWLLTAGIFQGCILLALAWVVSLMGERKACEAG